MSDNNAMKEYLAENPRMLGALFTLTLLLSQAGTVVASEAQPCSGP